MIEIESIKTKMVSSLFANLPEECFVHENPLVFETNELQMYDQGMVLYETTLEKIDYSFKVIVHDYAVVYIGDKFLEILDRTRKTEH